MKSGRSQLWTLRKFTCYAVLLAMLFSLAGITNPAPVYADNGAESSAAASLIGMETTSSTDQTVTSAVYTVTVDSGISGGAIVVNPVSAAAGVTVTVTVTPGSGKQLVAGSLRYNAGTDETGITATDGVYSFVMPAADVTVTAQFVDIPAETYTVTADTAIGGGGIAVDPASGAEGTTVTVTVTPDTGKQLVAGSLKYTADGGNTYTEITATDGVYSFVMPAADVTVTAQFEAEPAEPSIWDGTADTSWYTANPALTSYTISTPEQLAGLSYLVNASEEEWTGLGLSLENPDYGEQQRFVGKNITLANDIWLNATTGTAKGDTSQREWTPIGGGGTNAGSGSSETVQYSFGGTFDGAKHTVYNVYIDKGRSSPWSANYGFFGLLPVGGTLKNLTVTGFVDADRSVGGILGKNWGTVENCVNYATVKGYESKGVGGIVGANWYDGETAPPPVIRGCTNYGAVETAYGTGLCGGIAGDSEGIIENCANYGTISAASEGMANIGGITGNIKTIGAEGAGIVRNCFNAGAIIRGQWTAGVVAQVQSGNAIILNCYNTGSVAGGGNTDYAGGILGNHKGGAVSITNCYNAGAITAGNNAGAIAGKLEASSSTLNLYYLTGSSALAFGTGAGASAATATGKSAAQMQEAAFAAEVSGAGRSFVAKTGDYPILRWQTTDTGEFTRIAITTPPAKTVYSVGQSFDPAGMVVAAYYDDGTSEPVANYTYAPTGALTADDDSITVSYSGQTAVQPIRVTVYRLTGIAVKTPPTRTFYAPGDTVDKTGLTITATYVYNEETETEDLSEGFQVTPAVLTADDTEITISYTAGEVTGTTTYPVKVGDYPPAFVDDVYQLGTANDLLWFADFVNVGGNVSTKAALTGDIDLSGVAWTPIGTSANKYAGRFYGGGHQITLNLDGGSAANQGLFGYAAGAAIRDLTVAGSVTTTAGYVAGLVARAEGVTIQNCVNKATISGGANIAGILGHSTTGAVNVTGCTNQGAITATADTSNVGGIVGYITGGSGHVINNCLNRGLVTGKGSVGGILGSTSAAVAIADCVNEGAVVGAKPYTGGVAGRVTNASASIARSGNTAAITSTSNDVGGILGNATQKLIVSLCYNTGAVSGAYNVGGIIGNSAQAMISNCYNTGGISASAGGVTQGAGGIAGLHTTSAITNCYSTGAVTGTGNACKGAVVGRLSSGSTPNCYYLEGAAALGVGKGTDATTSKTETELKSADFATLLGAEYVAQDNAYPILAWQVPAPPATYTVTVDSAISGGGIAVDQASAAAGDTVTVTVTPDTGKQLVAGSLKYTADSGATYTGITAADGVYSFILPAADVTVTAQFEEIPPATYSIIKAPISDPIWSITTDKTAAAADETVTVTVSDTTTTSWATGLVVTGESSTTYEFTTITAATGDANGLNGAGVYSFAMPAEPVTVGFTADYTRLEVYIRYGAAGEDIPVHSYTRADMEALAAENTEPIHYAMYDQLPAVFMGKAVRYVTINQLTASAATYNSDVRFNGPDCSLRGASIDSWTLGANGISWDYLMGQSRKYYAGIGDNYLAPENRTGGDRVVPAVLAITGGAGRREQVDNQPYDTMNAYRFFYGQTEAEYGGGVLPTQAEKDARSTAMNTSKWVNKVIFVVPETSPATYTVTVDNTISGGGIAVDQASAAAGDTVTVTVTPDTGKQLVAGSLKYTADSGATYTGITAADGVYSFILPAADVTVTAQFEDEPAVAYTVTVDNTISGGGIAVDQASAAAGDTVTVTVTPDTGKQLVAGSLKYTADSGATYTGITAADGVYSFILPAADITVTAQFSDLPPEDKTPPALTADTTDNTVSRDADLTFTPDAAWQSAITGITVNGAPLDSSRYTVADGSITIAANVFSAAGDYAIAVQAGGYQDGIVTQIIVNAVYTVTPAADAAYQNGATADGITTMTVNPGVTGLRYFSVRVATVRAHEGLETVVFKHLRNGVQLSINATRADFDNVQTAKAGFNVQPGDVVEIYIVDELTNALGHNPIILQ